MGPPGLWDVDVRAVDARARRVIRGVDDLDRLGLVRVTVAVLREERRPVRRRRPERHQGVAHAPA